MHNPVGWFEIYVQDMPRARRFYEAVFATALEQLPAPFDGMELWVFPMREGRMGAPGALVKKKGVASGGNSVLVYFSCEDCAVEESRVVDAGGTVLCGKFSIGEYGFVAMVHDSEGNLIGMHSRK